MLLWHECLSLKSHFFLYPFWCYPVSPFSTTKSFYSWPTLFSLRWIIGEFICFCWLICLIPSRCEAPTIEFQNVKKAWTVSWNVGNTNQMEPKSETSFWRRWKTFKNKPKLKKKTQRMINKMFCFIKKFAVYSVGRHLYFIFFNKTYIGIKLTLDLVLNGSLY